MFGAGLLECMLVLCVSAALWLGTVPYQHAQANVWQQRLHAHQQHIMVGVAPSWSQAFAHANSKMLKQVTQEGGA